MLLLYNNYPCKRLLQNLKSINILQTINLSMGALLRQVKVWKHVIKWCIKNIACLTSRCNFRLSSFISSIVFSLSSADPLYRFTWLSSRITCTQNDDVELSSCWSRDQSRVNSVSAPAWRSRYSRFLLMQWYLAQLFSTCSDNLWAAFELPLKKIRCNWRLG